MDLVNFNPNIVRMSTVSENIRYLRKRANFTQQEFADKLDIKRSLVGAYEEGRADPRINNLIKISELFKVSIDDLVDTEIWKMSESELLDFYKGKQKQKFKVLSISIDSNESENIHLVPQKASAGYLNGYADPEYLNELPSFQLPFLPTNASYRAFEISGDSMLPIKSGTIVIGSYLESVEEIKNGKTYIIITLSEGVVFKRIFNYISEKGKLFLVSDNRVYSPYEVEPDDVTEIWEAKAYISVDFTDPAMDKSSDMSVDQLASMVMELKGEVARMKEN